MKKSKKKTLIDDKSVISVNSVIYFANNGCKGK